MTHSKPQLSLQSKVTLITDVTERNIGLRPHFRELDLIEQWGSGVRRIFKEAEQLGLPELQILEIGMRLRFVIPLAEQLPVKNSAKQVEAQVGKDILTACTRQPVSSSEIAAALGHKKLSGNLRKALPRVEQAGLLEFTIPDKPQSKLQKYRLTELGVRYLEKIDNKQGET